MTPKWMNRCGWLMLLLGTVIVSHLTRSFDAPRSWLVYLGLVLVAVGVMTRDFADERRREEQRTRGGAS